MNHIYLLQIDGQSIKAFTREPSNETIINQIAERLPYAVDGGEIHSDKLDADYSTTEKFCHVLKTEGWAEVQYTTIKLDKVALESN